MKKMFNKIIRPIINRLGIEVTKYRKYPHDFSEIDIRIWEVVRPYTMTSPERVSVLIGAVRYLLKNKIDGAMVECGVWKGGSTMAIALALKEFGDENRDIYLYDTFSGMSKPTEVDVSQYWGKAGDIFSKKRISEEASDWCSSPLEEVKRNIASAHYPAERMHFIPGKVEESIPRTIPEKIALLRLDTDWYVSTKHEMTHLFPLLAEGGIIIIDDYGCWEGARKAVDEYISENNLCIFLSRIDSSACIAVKAQ